MKIKSRNVLRKTDEKALIKDIIEAFGDASTFIGKKLEYVETDEAYLIFVDSEPYLFKINNKVFPTVKGALHMTTKKRNVIVDSGAIKFVINGADIMGPGVVSADPDIKESDLVIIVEEVHGKALAIGKALVSGKEMVGKKGKVVKSIHYVGDKLWKLEQK